LGLESHPMKTALIIATEFDYRGSFLARAGRVLWNAIRLTVAAALVLVEPIVGFVCGLGLVLGVIVSILFEISIVGPKFPFLKVLSISLSFGLILFLYYGLLSLFVED
jgi:hypothetical protein